MAVNVKNKPSVVMLANAGHSPFDTRIFQKEARSLVTNGYSVSLIIPKEKDEEKDGVKILATSIPKTGWAKLFISPIHIFLKALKQPRQSIFHIHDSELLVIGFWLRLLGRKIIYDAHEDTPLQIGYQHWIPKLLKKPYAFFYFCLERMAGYFFQAIIAAEPVIAQHYPQKKTFLIRNFSKVQSFKNVTPEKDYLNRENTLIYIGLLSEPRGLFEMLKASVIAKQKCNFTFQLGGSFSPPSLENNLVQEFDVNFLGWVNYEELTKKLFNARIGIIVPKPNPRYRTNYPVKLFEYMAAGLPVIASAEGESAKFIKEANCGILVNPLDVNEIAKAIEWLFKNPDEARSMGERGQKLIFEKYNWELEEKVLLSLYQQF